MLKRLRKGKPCWTGTIRDSIAPQGSVGKVGVRIPSGGRPHRRITSPSYAVSSMSASSRLDMMVRSTTSLSSSSDLGSAAAAPPACSYAIFASEK